MRHVPAIAAATLAPAAAFVPTAALAAPDSAADRFDTALWWITRGIEAAGIAVIVVGALVATASFLVRRFAGREPDAEGAIHAYRASLGRAILLGLEFLVAADIIGTVAIEPTMESVAVLAGIVLIRTFLSISLEVEIEGRPPWRRGAAARTADGDR